MTNWWEVIHTPTPNWLRSFCFRTDKDNDRKQVPFVETNVSGPQNSLSLMQFLHLQNNKDMIDTNIIVPDSIVIAFFRAMALPLANVLQTCCILILHEKPSNSTLTFHCKRSCKSIKQEKTDCFLTEKPTRFLEGIYQIQNF